mmetsp:Transcript_9593/g.18917  ORF Transcript_9593/g.18917 Transcript_9593/m.18917 type:complete len:125 (-) Transcript_9593:68-442(-)
MTALSRVKKAKKQDGSSKASHQIGNELSFSSRGTPCKGGTALSAFRKHGADTCGSSKKPSLRVFLNAGLQVISSIGVGIARRHTVGSVPDARLESVRVATAALSRREKLAAPCRGLATNQDFSV